MEDQLLSSSQVADLRGPIPMRYMEASAGGKLESDFTSLPDSA